MYSSYTESLRKARQSRNMRIEEAAEITKIEPYYLEAIENGNFSVLPDALYTRGFIRSYARLLEVDPNPILRAYREFEPQSNQGLSSLSRVGMSRQRRHRAKRSKLLFRLPIALPKNKWFIFGSVGAFVLLVICLIWGFSGNDQPAVEAGTAITPVETGNPIVSEAKKPSVSLLKSSETYKYGDLYGVNNAEKVEVKIIALKPTEIRVRVNGPVGKMLAEQKLVANQTVTFTHEKWISLRVDHPNYVQIFVNGVLIDTSGQKVVQLYQIKLGNMGK